MGREPSCVCGDCAKCKHRIYMRTWYARHPGYGAASARARRDAAREYEREQYNSDAAFRARKLSRNTAVRAVMSGELAREPCEVCGAVPTEAHHDDYSKPLDVRWLCNAHHLAHHHPHLAVV